MKRKSFLSIIMVLFLLLGSILVVDFRIDIVQKVSATVREVGPGKTYSTIQEGIDAAQPGDTIYVYAGIYNETVTIDKTINLTGENKKLVILDGLGGTCSVQINADFVNISGITIKNATNGLRTSFRSNINVNDTILVNNPVGINFEEISYCNIYDNEIMNSSFEGLIAKYLTDSSIKNNYFHNNGITAISISLDSTRNVISNNKVYYNTNHGIDISQGSFNNTIENNTCYDNGGPGLRCDRNSNNNTYVNNTCFSNNAGLEMDLSRDDIVENNQLLNNYWNMWINRCFNITFINNKIGDGSVGVKFIDSNQSFFSNNKVYNHTNSGIVIESSNNNVLLNNSLYNNSYNIDCQEKSTNNIIINSTLSNPTNNDIFLTQDSTLTTLNTTFNKSRVSIFGQNSQLTVKWYLHINVVNPDLSLAIGARVRVEDNDNGSFRETYITWYDGWKRWVVVTEYVETSAGKTYFTPYNVSTWNRTLTAYAEPEPKMEKSEFVVLQLGKPIFYKKLYKGWNLISIPLLQNDTSTSSVLSSIAGKYNTIQYYNSTDNRWYLYPSGDLTNINSTIGIWIHMKEDSVLSINGSNPVRVPITINASGNRWNLIGYPTLYDESLADLDILGVDDIFDAGQAFDAFDVSDLWKHKSINKPAELNDLEYMWPGYGYWMHATTDGVIEIGPKRIIATIVAVEDPGEPGMYHIFLVSISGVYPVPMIDIELLIYDSSLNQYADQNPLRKEVTLQVGMQGVGMNCTFYDNNGNWQFDASDWFIAENAHTGDTITLINRLTGEIICQATLF